VAVEALELAQVVCQAARAQVLEEEAEPGQVDPEAAQVVLRAPVARKEQRQAGGLPLQRCCAGRASRALAELRA
jgi:hypothetical protein